MHRCDDVSLRPVFSLGGFFRQFEIQVRRNGETEVLRYVYVG